MRLMMKECKAVTTVMVERYRRATKKQKGQLLAELMALTGATGGTRWGCCAGADAARRVSPSTARTSAPGVTEGVGDHGLHLWQAPGGGVARDDDGT